MMTTEICPDREVLAAFSQGELSDDSFEQIAGHVQDCPSCQQRLHELETSVNSLVVALRQVKAVVTSDDDRAATVLTGAGDSIAPEAPPGYELLGEVGRGGMGSVHRARDVRLNRYVAVKLLHERYAVDSGAAARFLAEAQITGQLQHPGIPAVHELATLPDGRPFLAMKLVKGRTLAALLRERPDPAHERERFIAIFEQICQAVGYAHARRVIHRDLKPGNVMVGAFGEVQVMDWGLAKILPRDGTPPAQNDEIRMPETLTEATAIETPQESGSPTRTGYVMGTPAYMSSEQAGGEIRKLDARSDVFGLGAILCQILTGQPPYRGNDANEVRLQAVRGDMNEALAALDDCGAEQGLIALCKSCLAFEKDGRPSDAGEVAKAVEQHQLRVQQRLHQAELEKAAARVQAEEEKKRREVEQAKAREERSRRRWTLIAATAIVLLLATGTGGAFWYHQVQAERITQRIRQEEAKKQRLALAEQKIADALKDAQQARAKLHTRLAAKGGVFKLLNEEVRWNQMIQQSRAKVQRAKDLNKDAQNTSQMGISSHLQRQIREMEERLAQDEAHLQLALDLDEVRLERANTVGNKFNNKAALEKYPELLQQVGLDVTKGNLQQLSARIRQSPIRDQLVAALDDWALAIWFERNEIPKRHLTLTRLADPDPWRDQIRDPKTWSNREILRKLADEVRRKPRVFEKLSPQMLDLVGSLLPAGAVEIEWYRKAQILHPDDFWINFDLGHALRRNQQPGDAAGFFRVAIAIRPKTSAAYSSLGWALHDQKDLDAAIANYNKAIEINPANAWAYSNLGWALADQNDFDSAILCCKKAIKLVPKLALAYNNLGYALHGKKDYDGAIANYKEAIKCDPQLALAYNNAGLALRDAGKFHAAIKYFEECLKRLPSEHLTETNVTSNRQQCAQLVALEQKLPQALEGKIVAANELLDLADLCQRYLKRYHDAVKLYTAAYRAEPKLAKAAQQSHCYDAACGAVLAAAGKGRDADKIDDKGRIQLLQQARQWLQDYLERWKRQLKDRSLVLAAVEIKQQLERWQEDGNLASVREPKLQAALPDAQRQNWQSLWSEVQALCKQIRDRHIEELQHGRLTNNDRVKYSCFYQEHRIKLEKGYSYLIELASQRFDTYLILFNSTGKQRLMDNNDAAPGSHNLSRMWFTPAKGDTYIIRTTTLHARETGPYTLTIWRFAVVPQIVHNLHGTLSETKREQIHEVKLIAGKTYLIDMKSKQFDTVLRLEDGKGNQLAEDDDSGGNLNSRLLFNPKKDGTFRLIASSYNKKGRGAYEIIVREFADGKSAAESPNQPATNKNNQKLASHKFRFEKNGLRDLSCPFSFFCVYYPKAGNKKSKKTSLLNLTGERGDALI